MNISVLTSEAWELTLDAPGRINIIGEHVDYNKGFVLPTAIDKKIRFKFRKTGSHHCTIYSENVDASFNVDLASVKPSEQQWHNYLLGVVNEIMQLTPKLHGFECSFSSDIPVGSGVSSSAALTTGFAVGLNTLFKLDLSKLDIVALSQRAEHHYVGTKCGIMDQFASVMSKKDQVVLLDCNSLGYTYIPMQIAPYKLLLLNTNVSHNLASGGYNTRRSECEQGVAILQRKNPQVTSLREVSLAMLEAAKSDLPPIVYKRCRYVVDEIARVLKAVDALNASNLPGLGQLMYETHAGLQHGYEVSCAELDFLVEFSKSQDQILGARMMGGGFGGCTINLIHEDILEDFRREVSDAYEQKFNLKLSSFVVSPSAGTTIVS